MGWSWLGRASVAVLASVALVLPWRSSSGPVYVVDGPVVTADGAFDNGFVVLDLAEFGVILLTGLLAVVLSFVSREATIWAGAATGVEAAMVAIGAFTREGVAIGPVVLCAAGTFLLVRAMVELAGRRVLWLLVVLIVAVPALAMTPDLATGSETETWQTDDRFDESTRLIPVNGEVAVLHEGVVRPVDDTSSAVGVRVADSAVPPAPHAGVTIPALRRLDVTTAAGETRPRAATCCGRTSAAACRTWAAVRPPGSSTVNRSPRHPCRSPTSTAAGTPSRSPATGVAGGPTRLPIDGS